MATFLAVGSLAAGFLLLAAYCLVEGLVSNVSLVDAYWHGRLPWMGWIEGLVVAGASATVVAGGLATLVQGGWWRRAALVPLTVVAATWWLAAAWPVGINYAPCPGCGAPPFDPWAYAYSVPLNALVFLIVPAVAVAVLALAHGFGPPHATSPR